MTLYVVIARTFADFNDRRDFRGLWWVRGEAMAHARRLADAHMDRTPATSRVHRGIVRADGFMVQIYRGDGGFRDSLLFEVVSVEPQGSAIGRLAALA